MPRTFAVFVIAILALTACSQEKPASPPAQNASQPEATKPAIGIWGFDLAGMDKTVKPGDDFFRYANGGWFARAEIPPDRSSTGSFLDLSILSENRVQEIIADLEKRQANLSPQEKKVADLYKSFTDIGHLEAQGLRPAQKDLDTIKAAATHEDIARLMGSVALGTEGLFAAGIGTDDKNPDAYAIFIMQSGLGLPNRDYYLENESGTVAARKAYRAYIETMLNLGGVGEASAKAEKIFALETRIAERHWPIKDQRQADKIYNPMTVSELADFAPDFPWNAFFASKEIGPGPSGERQVIVAEKSAFPLLAAIFSQTPVETWRDYLIFHYLSDHATYLPKRFDDARFDFYGRVIAGQTSQLAREKRGVHFLASMIGEGVGELYVARYFPPSAKAKAQALVENLLTVYRSRIETRDWMSEETKKKALEKAASFVVKIGYPDTWRDYSSFTVDGGDLLGNYARGSVFEWRRKLDRIDRPVDRAEWYMPPQMVNAYYNVSMNEIVFPAAILQPPFFDPNADDAVNYGGIGAVIGHEISHGFDDQGSKYDAKGVLQNWWTEKDRANFDARTAALVTQYNAYSPLKGMFVKGDQTLGENIADLAGVAITAAAYELSLGGKPAPVLDGFTGAQRVYLGYAQVWRYKARDADIRRRLMSDVHAPPAFRVNGAVRNVDGWYEAFGVGPGNTLYLAPEMRVRLW